MGTQSLASPPALWQGACCSGTLDGDKGPGLWRTLTFLQQWGMGGKELASDRGHLPQQGKLAWLGGSILVNPGGPSVDGSPSAHTWLQHTTWGSARLG